jgi:hypothetical protein
MQKRYPLFAERALASTKFVAEEYADYFLLRRRERFFTALTPAAADSIANSSSLRP